MRELLINKTEVWQNDMSVKHNPHTLSFNCVYKQFKNGIMAISSKIYKCIIFHWDASRYAIRVG